MGQLKQMLREQILAEMTYDRQMSDEEIAELIDRRMDACMEEQPEEFPQTLGERLKLHRELFDSFRRLDILQELVDDPRVTEIMVNGPDQVFVETGGKIGRWEKSFESREQLEDLIQQIVSSVNRIVNTSTPLANARLSDGSRGHVVLEAPGGRQAFRRTPSSCGVGADSVKRSDFDDPEIPGANDDGAPFGLWKYFPGSRGPLKNTCSCAVQHFRQRRNRSGKNDLFECTLRVYPAR